MPEQEKQQRAQLPMAGAHATRTAQPQPKPQSEVICSAEKVDALPDEVLRAALEQSRKDLGEEREALWIALGDSLRLESELKKCRCDCERC